MRVKGLRDKGLGRLRVKRRKKRNVYMGLILVYMEGVGSGSAEDGLTATILAAVWPSFFVPVRMCEEAANGVNTGVFGRVIEARGKVVNDR